MAFSDLTQAAVIRCSAVFCVLSTVIQTKADSLPWLAEGLVVQQLVDDNLVPDCSAITVDHSGRIIASGRGKDGKGYIRSIDLHNGDRVSSTDLVSGLTHGAHGLYFHNKELFYTADNGIWTVRDTDADGFVDSQPERVLSIKTGGEHDAHAIRMGPDGYWYLICGNGPKDMYGLQNADSPIIPNPRAGVIWRISKNWQHRTVWAHGFRNAYDFDFAPDNRIVTFDSDGERDITLPWYRPTRVFSVAAGNDAGWVSRSWKRPNHDPEMPTVVAEFGRGSPTGVMRYRNQRLPKRFHRGHFVSDWTFGRVIFVGDDSTTEIVIQPKDTAGFAFTDIAELPDGRVVISVGGRRSRGGLYVIDAKTPGKSVRQDIQWGMPTISRKNSATKSITSIRQQKDSLLNQAAAQLAINGLASAGDEPTRLDLLTQLIESAGGLGPGSKSDPRGKEQAAAVFDAYRSFTRPKLPDELMRQANERLVLMLADPESSSLLRHEVVRALAVLESESPSVWKAIADDLQQSSGPTEKLHRLIALARLPMSRSDKMTADVVDAMLSIPVAVDTLKLNVDRNWSVRLGELFVALRHRDSLMPARLVTHPDFGHVSHLVWTERMLPEGLEIARRRYLTASQSEPLDPSIARFIALGDDAVPRRYVRQWLANPDLQDAAWLSLSRHPRESDVAELNAAALSLNKLVRDAATKALSELGHQAPQRTPDSQAIKKWIDVSQKIVLMAGDKAAGKALFSSQQCASCHNGAKALGPSLSGIKKRFGPTDLFRATVDPSHTIPDRYQALRVLTHDGEVLVGMKIYQSVDGITLLTADAKTKRVNAAQIDKIQTSNKSLMPEGLLDGLSHQQAADLMAFLSSL